MPVYLPDEKPFLILADRFAWFENVLAFEYGERDADAAIPSELNWLRLLPENLQLSLAYVECSLAYENPATGYVAAVWDVSGEDDLPWAVFLADDFGSRLLTEYSLLAEDAEPKDLDAVLSSATAEIPDRLLAGTFDRDGTPLSIPEWLAAPEMDEG